MRKSIFFLCIFYGSAVLADLIYCQGNYRFFANIKKSWKHVELKPGERFSAHSSEVSEIQLGKFQKYPALTIYPFWGITFKIVNKDLKIDTDKETYFKITGPNKKFLRCNIRSEAGL